MTDTHDVTSSVAAAPPREYVVVARRYRPQLFADLVGQEHVAQALGNAISTQRVGHAYLFTGARGVGKTSAARILAKALNCIHGPTPEPCNTCDICRSISSGDDVDVLEIDGASNRGIDEIRQLRQNVNVRPSRARFKIYIIDEVHMLTREAFNALLKTLEEPPEHVKFIFCTTEPTKIPITILSRCQRFDFAGISTRSIFARLQQIVAAEGVQAEDAALEVIARRAAGSMRDSQSLLEQLLAFAPERITVADVHGMLGTAGDQRLTALLQHLVHREAAAALAELDAAIEEGVDAGQLLEQLFGYFRDCMVATVGCPPEAFLYASPTSGGDVAEAGRQLGLFTVLAVMQILEQTLSRLRLSTQGRILAELALVRICHLEELDELAALLAQLSAGEGAARIAAPAARLAPPPASLKKNIEEVASNTGRASATQPRRDAGTPHAPREVAVTRSVTSADGNTGRASPTQPMPLTAENASEVWNQVLQRMSGMVVEYARQFDHVACASPERLVVFFTPLLEVAKTYCQRPEQAARFQQVLAEVVGRPIQLEFAVSEEAPAPAATAAVRTPSPQQRMRDVYQQPMVQQAEKLFGALDLKFE